MVKGAVNGLTLFLTSELAPKVRVNAIALSPIRTELAKDFLSNAQLSASIAELHTLQRLCTAEDIVSVTAFSLSGS